MDLKKLHPKSVVLITITFLAVVTIIAVIVIVNRNKTDEIIIGNKDEVKAQTIDENMKIGEAEEGILQGAEEPKVGVNNNNDNNTSDDGSETNEELLRGPLRSASNIPNNWDLSVVDAVQDTDGYYVPVPKGFTASTADGENTISSGFVIYEGTEEVNNDNYWAESKTRNQFVWVPVDDTSRVYTIDSNTGKRIAKLWDFTASGRNQVNNSTADTRREPGVLSTMSFDNVSFFSKFNLQNLTKDLFNKELQQEFDRSMDSILKYGGFYIGRYETGAISSNTPVVKRYNTDLSSYQAWYTMYPRMKNISTNENVQTGMIWGCLWDETLEWIIDTGNKTRAQVASDSSDWGSYSNVSFEYTNSSGSTYTKSANSATKIPAGSAERNKANNIYDMAGNVYDWTLESDTGSNRNTRGGNYYTRGSWGPAGNRGGFDPSYEVNSFGFRAYLYIKP